MEILASCHSSGGTKFVELGAFKYFAQKELPTWLHMKTRKAALDQ